MIFASGELKTVFVASSRALRLREVGATLKNLCNLIDEKIMAYTVRLRPKGIPFLASGMKG